jgi:hypothetical protein
VVINDFDIVGVTLEPSKTESPAPADPYGMLPQPVTLEHLKLISGTLKVSERPGRVEQEEFSLCRPFAVKESDDALPVEQSFRFPRPEGTYH